MATDKTYKVEPLKDASGKQFRLPGQEAQKDDKGVAIKLDGKFQYEDRTIVDVVEHVANGMDINFRAALTYNDMKAISHLRHACAVADGKLTIKADDWKWLKDIMGERVPPKGAMKTEFEVGQTYGGLLFGSDAPDLDDLISEGFIRDTDTKENK